jgi:hypothetical protein
MKTSPIKPFTVLSWTLNNLLGWLIGFALVMVVGIPLEGLHIFNQAMIGIGMGAGVGLIQNRAINKHLEVKAKWFWCTFIGMSVPYILNDLLSPMFKFLTEETLPVVTTVGGLLIGIFHYQFILKNKIPNSKSWILFSCIGWAAAHWVLLLFAYFVNYKSLNHWDIPVFFKVAPVVLVILSGGPILGLVTGRKIIGMLGSLGNS